MFDDTGKTTIIILKGKFMKRRNILITTLATVVGFLGIKAVAAPVITTDVYDDDCYFNATQDAIRKDTVNYSDRVHVYCKVINNERYNELVPPIGIDCADEHLHQKNLPPNCKGMQYFFGGVVVLTYTVNDFLAHTKKQYKDIGLTVNYVTPGHYPITRHDAYSNVMKKMDTTA